MSGEFLDTNILLYAHEPDAGSKQMAAIDLVARLARERTGAVSLQVLSEFYSAGTTRLKIPSKEAEEVMTALGAWTIHRPEYDDLLRALHVHRHYRISWWDALILNSATQLGCSVLWTEDLNHGQRYGSVTARNPFRA